MTKHRNTILATSLLFSLSLSTGAMAQQEYEEPSAPPASAGQQQYQTGGSIDEKTVEQFASAYQEILEIQVGLSDELKEVSESDKARELQQQAQQEMLQVVEQNGLSVDDYNNVVAQMQQDVTLRNQILDLIDQ
jgi:hypothetical protein